MKEKVIKDVKVPKEHYEKKVKEIKDLYEVTGGVNSDLLREGHDLVITDLLVNLDIKNFIVVLNWLRDQDYTDFYFDGDEGSISVYKKEK